MGAPVLVRPEAPPSEFEARVVAAKYGDLRAYAKAVHNIEIEAYQEAWEEALNSLNRTIIICPPDTYKTTTVRMWCEQQIGRNPNIRILWLQNAGDQAQKQVMTIQRTIDSNNVYRGAFGVEEDTGAQWTKSVLFVRRAYTGPEPTIMGCGLNGPYQGLHFDVIIIDDPTNQEDVRSPTTMELQTSKLRGVIVDRLVEGGRIVGILTRWGETDLVPTFADMGFDLIEMPIAGDYPWGPTLSPKRFTPERVEAIRRDKGDMLFALTFMCSTSATDGNIIKREHIGYWDASTIPNRPLNIYMAVDPAASTKTSADYCLGPDTRILNADFSWCRLSDIKVGDRLVGVDEFSSIHYRRKMEPVVVEAITNLVQPSYKIRFTDGREVVASSRHRWLARVVVKQGGIGYSLDWDKPNSTAWVSTSELKPGIQIRQAFPKPWDIDQSYSSGYLAGFLDGEGYLQGSSNGKTSLRLGFAQNDGQTLEQVLAIAGVKGVPFKEHKGRPPLRMFDMSGVGAASLVGTVRPSRLLPKLYAWLDSRPDILTGPNGASPYAVVESIEHIGEQDVVGLQTSSKTFIAEGLVSHNSAIATVGTDLRSRKIYALDVWAKRLEVPDLEFEIQRRAKKTSGLRALGLETVGFQLSLVQSLKRKYNLPLREIPYRSRRSTQSWTVALDRDKVGRAAYLDALFASGRLLLPRGLPLVDGVSLETELCLIPYGKHDDRMDALSMACVLADGARLPLNRRPRFLFDRSY